MIGWYSGHYTDCAVPAHPSGKGSVNIRVGTCKHHTEGRSRNHCCLGNAISITYCECVSVDLGIQHAMRMRHVLCGLPALQYFFIYNGTIFGGKKLLHVKCVFLFSLHFFFPETVLILRTI
jgi:hypothetical protein